MATLVRVSTGHKPRAQQLALHRAKARFKVLVAHRRFGKTVFCINELIARARRCALPAPRYAYVAPTQVQAKDVAWSYLKQYTAAIPDVQVNETELWVELPPRQEGEQGARIRLYGAEHADRLRGLYFDGMVLDEYAYMSPRVWTEVIRPALADRQGWAIFIGTPLGRNGFADLYEGASRGFTGDDGTRHPDPDWAGFLFKASETGIVAEAELEAARRIMSPDQYAQEFECSFDAAVPGAYYASLIAQAEQSSRIKPFPHEPALPVHTGWDLGIGDPLPAATLESGFDRAAMRDQQLKDAVDRAMRFPPTIDPGVSAELPAPAADRVLGWNGAGSALENKNLPTGSAVYSSVANTRLGVSAAEAVTPASLAALWKKGADIASAATLAKPSDPVLGGYHAVSGTATIQFLWGGEANGCPLELRFDGVLTLTHATSGAGHLYLPGLANITTAVGDTAAFKYETTSQRWRCTRYTRTDGTALVAPPPVNTAGALLSLFNNCI